MSVMGGGTSATQGLPVVFALGLGLRLGGAKVGHPRLEGRGHSLAALLPLPPPTGTGPREPRPGLRQGDTQQRASQTDPPTSVGHDRMDMGEPAPGALPTFDEHADDERGGGHQASGGVRRPGRVPRWPLGTPVSPGAVGDVTTQRRREDQPVDNSHLSA